MTDTTKEYVVSYRYFKNGEIARGGEWLFNVIAPEDAKKQFFILFEEAEPDYRQHELKVDPPYLSANQNEADQAAEMLALRNRVKELEQFVQDVVSNAPDDEPKFLNPASLPYSYALWVAGRKGKALLNL